MRLKRLKSIMLIVLAGGIGALLMWTFMKGHKGFATEQDSAPPVKEAAGASTQGSKSVLTLDKDAQIKGGIVVAPLETISHQEEVQAYGVVVELQDLADLYGNYSAAKAQVKKMQASLEASRKDYERVKTLYEDNKNVSEKAFQAAEATWRSDEASARAAQDALHSLEATARQRWGGVLAKWLFEVSPAFDRLIKQEDVLIQITLPSDVQISSAPQTAWVEAADGKRTSAEFLSLSPRTDPRLQGMSFFYLVPAQTPGLLPGMNVLAYLPVGPPVQGVVVPASATVWWQGKVWTYMQKEPEHFVRREVSTEAPVKDGWFVVKDLSAGDRLVVSGAQLLLSEEFHSQIQEE